jgi:RNA polymerase-binding protein DksA
VARPTKKTPASKTRAKPAPPRARPSRPAASKHAAKAPKKPAKAIRAKAPAAKAKARPKGPAKPATKPAARPLPAKTPAAKTAVKAVVKAVPKPQPKEVVKAAAPKPVVAKPAPVKAPEPPKKPRKPELTPKEIATIRASLLEQRNIFTREFSDLEEGTFNISQSEMSGEVSFDEEYADAGSFTFEREKELSIGNNIRDLLDKVNHALSAIDHGTYGICENCGNPIAKARLLALPYSTLCLTCKQTDERTR